MRIKFARLYLQREDTPNERLCMFRLLERNSNPSLRTKGSDVYVKLRNIWTIMTHISKGLEFLHCHKQAHRDLKPQNGNPSIAALTIKCFSPKRTQLWKITDFGISTEGRQSNARSTEVCPRYNIISCPRDTRRTLPKYTIGWIFGHSVAFYTNSFSDGKHLQETSTCFLWRASGISAYSSSTGNA